MKIKIFLNIYVGLFVLFLFNSNRIYSDEPVISVSPSAHSIVILVQPQYGGSEFWWGNINDYGYEYDQNASQSKTYRAGFKFSFSIPNDAFNITSEIVGYNSAGTANILLLDDGTNFSDAEELWDAISDAYEDEMKLFDIESTANDSWDITDDIQDKFDQGYFKLGCSGGEFDVGYVTMELHIYYETPAHITAKNIFNGGSINVGVNSSAAPETSPFPFSAIIGSTVNLGADEQNNGDYYWLWNDTEAPKNPSKWDRNGEQKSFSQAYSFPTTENDDYKTYQANLRKRCNITFRNEHIGGITGGTIKVNGTNYNSPTSSFPIVELNDITGGANWHAINGIEYTFDYWSDGGGSTVSHTFNPSYHKDYKAYFVGRPLNSYGSYNRNLNFNTSDPVGTPIEVRWNQHPNSNVSEYRIYRKTKYGAETKIKTVTRTTASSYTYTDGLYSITNNTSSDNLLSYDVRAYYSTEGTVSDYDWRSVYGEILFKQTEEDLEERVNIDVLEYAMSNYPNPFNPTTTIHYQLPEDANVSIKVFDILGKQIAELVNGTKGVGKHNVMFNSSNLSAGLYIYTIEAKPTNLDGVTKACIEMKLLVK